MNIIKNILIALLVLAIVFSISPYVNFDGNPPSEQYHHISEIWINESVIDWQGIIFKNISQICFDKDCNVTIYYDPEENALIIKAPKIKEIPSIPWYYSDFSYRRKITIQERSGNNLYDYQVMLTVNTANLISQGKMNPDCSDIRFTYLNTSDNNQYEIPYWIESGCNTANTRIWIKVPYIPANGNITVYMYYGNPDAISRSNGNAVFLAFNLSWEGPVNAGDVHTCALLANGSVTCWGYNGDGRLGDGTNTTKYIPVLVKGIGGTGVLSNVVAIAAGGAHTCALLANGSVACWGDNYYGQLGDGTNTTKYIPVLTLNYNLGGMYDKTKGIYAIHRPPYYSDIYFVRKYAPVEPSYSLGPEEAQS